MFLNYLHQKHFLYIFRFEKFEALTLFVPRFPRRSNYDQIKWCKYWLVFISSNSIDLLLWIFFVENNCGNIKKKKETSQSKWEKENNSIFLLLPLQSYFENKLTEYENFQFVGFTKGEENLQFEMRWEKREIDKSLWKEELMINRNFCGFSSTSLSVYVGSCFQDFCYLISIWQVF